MYDRKVLLKQILQILDRNLGTSLSAKELAATFVRFYPPNQPGDRTGAEEFVELEIQEKLHAAHRAGMVEISRQARTLVYSLTSAGIHFLHGDRD